MAGKFIIKRRHNRYLIAVALNALTLDGDFPGMLTRRMAGYVCFCRRFFHFEKIFHC